MCLVSGWLKFYEDGVVSSELEIALLINNAGASAVGGALIGVWHDIKGKRLPEFRTVDNPENDPPRRQARSNISERGAFVMACTLLSSFVGLLIGLYYLGFAKESTPNIYGQIFIALLAGFLMPKLLEHSEKMSISKLISRFTNLK
ncbi:TPA: hypothetical protein ACMDWJ_003484 [Vibrio cholerae]